MSRFLILLYLITIVFSQSIYSIKYIDNSEWDAMENHTLGIECYYLGLFCDNPRKLYNSTLSSKVDNHPITLTLPQQPINYTELGIFISGLILSVGGFCSLMLGNCRKSNCSSIKCGCIKIERNNLEIEEV